jgi:hypothetical protein
VAEVCREHRASDCGTCDEFNDDLWVHPRDMPAPHEDCTLCARLVRTRVARIAEFNWAIEWMADEIIEIKRGMRHTAFHEEHRRTVMDIGVAEVDT